MTLKFCLGIFSTDKNRFKPIKITTSDSRIFAYFPNDFGKKMEFFSFSIIGQKGS